MKIFAEMEESTNLNVSNRKIRKPLMERKRRARINKCLNELHQILTETDMTPKGTKLEKADILEMTVKYLKHMKQSCCSKEDKENLQNLMLEQYFLGFEKCSKEVGKYVATAPEVDFVMKHKINTYLMSCLAKVKSQPVGFEGSDFKPRTNKEGKILESSKASVFVQANKKFKILPSKLANGDFVLLLSSSDLEKSEESLRKSDMWRPW